MYNHDSSTNMRIRNKEIRQRRKRKADRIKQMVAEAKAAAKGGSRRSSKPASEGKPAAAPKKTTTRAKKTEGAKTTRTRTVKKAEAPEPAQE